jgi:type IV secretion system protein TrbC
MNTRHTLRLVALTAALLLLPILAHAAGGGAYAWETTLQRVIASLTGPVAGGIGVGAIVLFGLGLAMSDGGGLRVVIGIIFGLSVAFSAVSLVATLFGFGGGALL